MKYLKYGLFLTFIACASYRTPKGVAHDSIGSGSVSATATKKISKQDVCFDIAIVLSGTSQQSALPGNWSLAWVDKKNQYHLLSLNQRDPASVPTGSQVMRGAGQREWKNTFHICADKTELDNVKGIVLTPKELPIAEKRSLRLDW